MSGATERSRPNAGANCFVGSAVSLSALIPSPALFCSFDVQNKLFFIETSALADSNVGTAFETILKEIHRLISRKTVGADGTAAGAAPQEFKQGDTIALTAENQNPAAAPVKGKCCS